jgi:HlyD family secretion protein
MNKRIVAIGVIAIVLIAGYFLTSGSGGGTAIPFAPKPTPTAIAALADLDTIVSASGTLLPAKRANLAFKTIGQVMQVAVKQGDRVKKGDVLVKLDTADLDANVAATQAGVDAAKAALAKIRAGATKEDVEIAKANLDRAASGLKDAQAAYDRVAGDPWVGMLPQARGLEAATQDYRTALARYNQVLKGATAEDIKVTETNVSAAEARLAQARSALAAATLTAPFDGTLATVNVREGEFVTMGVPLIVIGDLTTLQLETDDLSETNIARVTIGQTVKVTFEAMPGRIFNGKVTQIAPIATAKSGGTNFTVTVVLDALAPELRWGMTGHVEINTK